MTLPGRPGGGATAGNAMSRGLILIGIAVLLGLFLLWKGLDDGSVAATADGPAVDGGSDDGGSGDDGDGTDGTDETDGDTGADATDGVDAAPTSTTEDLFPARPPAEVKVLVANGSGTGGAAGAVTSTLLPLGFTTLEPANAADNEQPSRVFYRAGYRADAISIQTSLQAAVDTLMAWPADGTVPVNESAVERAAEANVVVIIGADGLIPIPSAG